MRRRMVLSALGGVALLGGAGAYHRYGDDLTRLSASPVGVDDDARRRAGYREPGVEAVTVEEPLPGGVDEVVVTNYLTQFEKGVEVGLLGRARAAVFVALSTPQVRLAGREFNPVEEMSTDELVALVQDNYDGIETVSRDDVGAVTILGQPTAYARYTAEAAFDGVAIPVDLLVTRAVETASDLVVAIGVYPRELRALEAGHVRRLMEGIREEPPAAGGEPGGAPGAERDGARDDERAGAGPLSEAADGLDPLEGTDELLSGSDGIGGVGGGLLE